MKLLTTTTFLITLFVMMNSSFADRSSIREQTRVIQRQTEAIERQTEAILHLIKLTTAIAVYNDTEADEPFYHALIRLSDLTEIIPCPKPLIYYDYCWLQPPEGEGE